ncbi:MAG: hypothetical protein IAF08_15445, partial [Rhizobacter sp.]|nr:hypothetical protein [Chlorobiales bacterium]
LRAMKAPCINQAIALFNLSYIHMYGLSRRDLHTQLERLKSEQPDMLTTETPMQFFETQSSGLT